jgi:hypothetical protein
VEIVKEHKELKSAIRKVEEKKNMIEAEQNMNAWVYSRVIYLVP